MPSGIVVQRQSERSLHQNRAHAFSMLCARLYEAELHRREAATDTINASKTDIGWGHQIRSYVLQPYQMVKDLRTGVETSNARRGPRRLPRRRPRLPHRTRRRDHDRRLTAPLLRPFPHWGRGTVQSHSESPKGGQPTFAGTRASDKVAPKAVVPFKLTRNPQVSCIFVGAATAAPRLLVL
jgi:hypothetical protein